VRISVAATFAAGLAAAVAFAPPAAEAAGKLAIVEPWARATPGTSQTGAVYLTIRSAEADRLVAAATPVAKKAEMHATEMSGMVMRMRPLAAVTLPAGRSVAFAPGGMHIMLEGLKAPLRAGQSFPLTLTFAKAGPQTVTVVVGPVGATGPPAAAH